jgi:hypothetical protein
LGALIAVQLAEQGIAVFFCPISEMNDEVLDLLAGGIAQGLGAAEIYGVRLHQIGIELVLPNELAEAITNPRSISISISVMAMATIVVPNRLGWELTCLFRFTIRLNGTSERSDFLNRADANPIRFAQSAINSPSFGYAHLGAVHERRDIRWIGVTVANKALATWRLECNGLEYPSRVGRVARFENRLSMDAKATLSSGYRQKPGMADIPSIINA